MATLVERHSRFAMLIKVSSKETDAVVAALSRRARKLPATLRRSLTWDRGLEMAQHNAFTVATDVQVYSTSAIRKVPGNAGRTKTPICCYGNTFPRHGPVRLFASGIALRIWPHLQRTNQRHKRPSHRLAPTGIPASGPATNSSSASSLGPTANSPAEFAVIGREGVMLKFGWKHDRRSLVCQSWSGQFDFTMFIAETRCVVLRNF